MRVENSERLLTMAFEPKILGFLCNWCSYTGADLAGVSRIKSAPNVRVVRTMCSGRVDPAFILKAFQLGADGVVVMGCHLGDCHYQEGNYKTIRRIPFLKRLVKEFGIDPRRLRPSGCPRRREIGSRPSSMNLRKRSGPSGRSDFPCTPSSAIPFTRRRSRRRAINARRASCPNRHWHCTGRQAAADAR